MATGTQISTSVTIISSLLGFQGLSLTNFTTSALSAISQGSKLEVAGAFFNWAGDETPNASSWTAIATAATAYLQCTPSGSAGTQILTASWTTTAPTFSVTKQGWYASAASAVRVVASVYKTSATQQDKKRLLLDKQAFGVDTSGIVSADGGIVAGSGNATLLKKIIEIGDWNMDSTDHVNITHGLTLSKIVSIEVLIINDAGTSVLDLTTSQLGNYWDAGATYVVLNRINGGQFDSTGWDSTGYNRGYVTIEYTP